jgi:outer membrane protease
MQTIVSKLCLLIACVIISVSPVVAADFDFSVSSGYLLGDSTYQIGGHVDAEATGPEDLHFPISELKFPLDAVMLKAEFGVDFADRWRFSLSGQTNITDDTGKMEDSDWVTPGSLDIYSESDTDMRAWLFDGKLSYTFYRGNYGETWTTDTERGGDVLFFYSAGVGYKHQHYDFDVSNVDQWYPSSPSTPHDRYPGPVLTYEVEFWMPYIELAMELNKADKFFFNFSLAYAPRINAKDEDHHLLRSKVNRADHDWNGDAHFITAKGRYNINEHWFVALEVEKIHIESEGRSDAYLYGVYDHTIDHEIKSDQLSSFLKFGYSF